MRQTDIPRLLTSFRARGPTPLDSGLVLGLLWILAVAVVDNSTHTHVAVIPEATHNTFTHWLLNGTTVVLALTALALRHRQPLMAMLAVAGAVIAAPAVLLLLGPALIALYTVAAARPPRETALSATAVLAAFVLQRVAWGPGGEVVLSTVVIGASGAVGLGLYAGLRRESARERRSFQQRQDRLEDERIVAEERLRIARELHDVVGHTLSLMIVQSEVLRSNLADEERRDNAAAIAELGRAAMAEFHRTLGLLRGADERSERSPQPALCDLEQLAEQSREGGLDVEVGIEGPVRPLPASFELCAYRIVQEALTNVRKHADAANAVVHLRFGAESLEMAIEDDGDGVASEVASAGYGLRGIRERAEMLGGAVCAGPREQGGYRVSAVLPYPEPV